MYDRGNKHGARADRGTAAPRREVPSSPAEPDVSGRVDPRAPEFHEAEDIISRLERLVQEIACSQASAPTDGLPLKLEKIRRELKELDRRPAGVNGSPLVLTDEIEQTILARMGAFQRVIFKSMMAICSNVLDNSRAIDQLNSVVDTLPGERKGSFDVRRMLSNIETKRCGAALSRRENEILTQLLGGKNNKEISGELGISDKTVKNHLWKIYRKLGVESRTQLFHKLIS